MFAEESCQFEAIYKRKRHRILSYNILGVSSNSLCGYCLDGPALGSRVRWSQMGAGDLFLQIKMVAAHDLYH